MQTTILRCKFYLLAISRTIQLSANQNLSGANNASVSESHRIRVVVDDDLHAALSMKIVQTHLRPRTGSSVHDVNSSTEVPLAASQVAAENFITET